MEKFLGTWKLIPEETVGLEQYVDAMKVPEAVREKIRARSSDATITTTQNGDSYTLHTTFGDGTEESYDFKLGEPVTYTNASGFETKSVVRLEGDRVKGEHETRGRKFQTTRYVEGDRMFLDVEGEGATLKTVYRPGA